MALAVSGDRGTTLGLALGSGAHVFAVAEGFGTIDHIPTAGAALARLRAECERRSTGERLRRVLQRSDAASGLLLGAMGRVNAELFVRSAAHDDYVTAGCSLTAVLVNGRRAFVAHAGSTAAYLVRAGFVMALTQDDAVREGRVRILTRSMGTQAHLEASVCNFTFDDGDTLVLTDRRLRDEDDRRRLALRLRGRVLGEEEGLLLVRYAGDETPEPAPVESPRLAYGAIWPKALALLGFLLTLLWAR